MKEKTKTETAVTELLEEYRHEAQGAGPLWASTAKNIVSILEQKTPEVAAQELANLAKLTKTMTLSTFYEGAAKGLKAAIKADSKPLNTETNTPAMEKRVLQAAHKALKRRNLSAFFEHGQWWIEHRPSGAQWSVCDASGPHGFDFEQVTQGEAA